MKNILVLGLCLLCSVSIEAQKRKTAAKVTAASSISAQVLNTIQLDSTAAFTIYAEGNFLTFTTDGSFASVDSTGNKIWEQRVFGDILVQPVISNKTIVIATANNEINTYNLETGAQLQSIGTEESITAPLIVYNYSGSNELMISKETNS
ncbi:MAG: PQQ-binding-like beta-propeller repeat protein, partial [Bacteroidota bacterium]